MLGVGQMDKSQPQSRPSPRWSAAICLVSKNTYILHGGYDKDHNTLQDIWAGTISSSLSTATWTCQDNPTNEFHLARAGHLLKIPQPGLISTLPPASLQSQDDHDTWGLHYKLVVVKLS